MSNTLRDKIILTEGISNSTSDLFCVPICVAGRKNGEASVDESDDVLCPNEEEATFGSL